MSKIFLIAAAAVLLSACGMQSEWDKMSPAEQNQRLQMLNGASQIWQKQYGQQQPVLQCTTWNNTTTCY